LKLIEELFSVKDETIMEYLNKREVDSNTILYCKEIIDFFDKTLDIQKCDAIDTLSQFEDNFILKGVDSYLDEKFKTYLESQDKLFAIKNFFNEKIKKFEKKENDYIKIHETEKSTIRIIATKRRCSLLKEELSKDKRKMQRIATKLKFQTKIGFLKKGFILLKIIYKIKFYCITQVKSL
jgi:hypothetical protein